MRKKPDHWLLFLTSKIAKKTLQKPLDKKTWHVYNDDNKTWQTPRLITHEQGGFIMDREQILARNRKENEGREDERELKIFADASKFGMAVGGILAVLIVLFSRITKIPELGFGAWALYFAMFGSRRAYQYGKTKERKRLIQAIVGLVAGAACIAGMVYLGVRR